MAKVLQQSPSAGFVANLFGIPTKLDRKGGIVFNKHGTFDYANPVFGPGSSQSISDFLNLTGSNQYTTALGEFGRTSNINALPDILRQPYQSADATLGSLVDTATPVVNALIQSGLPTDIGALTRASQSRFKNEILPSVSEQFNPAQGTAFQNIAAREAQLLEAELGKFDFDAQEAAKQRQLAAITQGAPALSALATARVGLPGATLGELSSLSSLTDPGQRLIEFLLPLIQGPTNQGAYVFRSQGGGGGGDSSSGLGDILGSVGSIIGIVGALAGCWVAEELWGVWDERTWLARAWCTANPNHPFVQRYMREGRQWAAAVHNNPELARAVEPTWAWMAQQGALLLAEAA